MDETVVSKVMTVTIGKFWNRIPGLVVHVPDPLDAPYLTDAAMQVGAELVDPGSVRKLPRPNPKVIMAVGPDRIALEIQRRSGKPWVHRWQMNSMQVEWRQMCFDRGGALVIIATSVEPEYLEGVQGTDIQFGSSFVLSPTMFFPRN